MLSSAVPLLCILGMTVFSALWMTALLRRQDRTEQMTIAELAERARDRHEKLLTEHNARLLKALSRAHTMSPPQVSAGAVVASDYSPDHRALLLVAADGAKLIRAVSAGDAAALTDANLTAGELTAWLLTLDPRQVSDAGFTSLRALARYARDHNFYALARSRRDVQPAGLSEVDAAIEDELHSDEDCAGEHLWILGLPADADGRVRSVWHYDQARRCFVPPTPRYLVRLG